MNKNAKQFIVAAESIFGSEPVLSRDDITKVVNESGAPYPYWLVTKAQYRYDRGQYKVPPSGEKIVKLSNLKQKWHMHNQHKCWSFVNQNW
jgi:hypothetical protein